MMLHSRQHAATTTDENNTRSLPHSKRCSARRRTGFVMRPLNRLALSGAVAALILAANGVWAAEKDGLSDFLGTWRGKSTCVNREAAPACTDEVVVYQVSGSNTPDTAVLEADKIVDGQRVPMGELAFNYSGKDGCWRSEFSTPRVHAVWCLVIDGRVITGSLRLLPENTQVRTVQLERE